MLFYSDPYKDNPYGKLQGELENVWCTLQFDELKVYKYDNSYVLAGIWTNFVNVVRSYKPEQAIAYPVKATLTLHSKDYQVRKKNDEGKYENVTYKASIHEKLLYQHIIDNPSQWLDETKNLKGQITHLNNATYAPQGDNPQLPANTFEVVQIEPTGNLPEWTPPKAYSGNGGKGGYYNNGVSLEDKAKFLKKELIAAVHSDVLKKQFQEGDAVTTPIHMILFEVVQQHKQDELFLAAYLDLLKGVMG